MKFWGLTLGLTVLCGGLGAIALSPAPVFAQNAEMLEGSWRLIGWGDANNLTPPLVDTEITANFDSEQITGSAGCNRYFGPYSVAGNMLEMGAIASTKMACMDAVDRQEMQYLTALDGAQSYAMSDRGELIINYQTETGSGVLVFAPQTIRGLW